MSFITEKAENEKRAKALMAAQARFPRSFPPKVTCVEEAEDKMPFMKLVNKIRGKKPAPEVRVEK
jgi:hypothetical protein